jgi:hypothetical protein
MQLRKDDRGHLAVEQKIVPLNRRADRAGDNGAAQLGTMVEVGGVTAASATVIGDPPLQPRFLSINDNIASAVTKKAMASHDFPAPESGHIEIDGKRFSRFAER